MAAYQLLDFGDIVDRILEEMKIPSTDTVNVARIKRVVNEVYINEVVPRKRWQWLSGHTDIRLIPYDSTGTVAVTNGSATITFSSAPASSMTGYKFSVEGYEEVLEISAHTAAASTATLPTAYTGDTNATATYKLWTNEYALPTDCRETVEVWHDFSTKPMEPVGRQELIRRRLQDGKKEGRPTIYWTTDYYDPTPLTDEEESDRYRLLKVHPSIHEDATTLHVEYVKEVDALELDADEPFMAIEDRICLVYGALAVTWRSIGRNPEEAAANQVLFERKLAAMAGRIEDGFDTPALSISSNYILMKRGKR
jgi:hypothetical protein